MALTPEEEARIARLEQQLEALRSLTAPLAGRHDELLGSFAGYGIVNRGRNGQGALHLSSGGESEVRLARNIRRDGNDNLFLIDEAAVGRLLTLGSESLEYAEYAAATGALSFPARRALLNLRALGGATAGSTLSSYRGANLAVAAGTPTTYASLALTEGTWLVQATVAVTQGAAAGLIDCYLNNIGFPGSVNLAAGALGVWQSGLIRRVVGSGGETLNARTFSAVGHTVTALGGVGGFSNVSGILAVCVG